MGRTSTNSPKQKSPMTMVKAELVRRENHDLRVLNKCMNHNAPLSALISLEKKRREAMDHLLHHLSNENDTKKRPLIPQRKRKVLSVHAVSNLPPHTCTIMWNGHRNHRNSMNCKRCNMSTGSHSKPFLLREKPRKERKKKISVKEPTPSPSRGQFEYVEPIFSIEEEEPYILEVQRFRNRLNKQIRAYFTKLSEEDHVDQQSAEVQTSPQSKPERGEISRKERDLDKIEHRYGLQWIPKEISFTNIAH